MCVTRCGRTNFLKNEKRETFGIILIEFFSNFILEKYNFWAFIKFAVA